MKKDNAASPSDQSTSSAVEASVRRPKTGAQSAQASWVTHGYVSFLVPKELMPFN